VWRTAGPKTRNSLFPYPHQLLHHSHHHSHQSFGVDQTIDSIADSTIRTIRTKKTGGSKSEVERSRKSQKKKE
jgi:hypothetical protein